MQVQPYLFFNGACEEASVFYGKAVGAQVVMKVRIDESPEPHPEGMMPPGSENKILHMTMQIGDTMLLASDGDCSGTANFNGFSLSLKVASETEAQQKFAALAEGGSIAMPLGPTFFAKQFGMLTDRFGIGWMVIFPLDA